MWFHLVCMDPIVGTSPFLKKGGVNLNDLPQRRRSESYLNQGTIEGWWLIHGQINLIKFVESKKLIKYTAKFETVLFDQIFKKSDVL